jgi:hypothetical protein
MSIAKNHLSKYGRFGDTEIVETSNGNLWHVNKFEKKLINDYGVSGERIVNAVGSGTINPITGLEEKFLPALIAAAPAIAAIGTFATTAYGSYKQGKMQKESASKQLEITKSALSSLGESEKALSDQVSSQLGFTGEQFKMKQEEVSKQASGQKDKITESIQQAKERSGFAYSGESERISDDLTKELRERTEKSTESLMGQFGLSMGEILGGFESEKARIKSERERLQIEKRMYQSMV